MTSVLRFEELAQWQHARDRLLQMIELVQRHIREERRKREPCAEKIATLEAQCTFLIDARYDLSDCDDDAVAAALKDQVLFRDQQICFRLSDAAEGPVATKGIH